MDELQSERLVLRAIEARDVSFFVHLHADPKVARTLGSGLPRTEQETRAWMSAVHQSYDRHDVGQLALWHRDEQRLIGRCGLTIYEIEAPRPGGHPGPRRCFWGAGSNADVACTRELEVGFVIDSQDWGKGYATEAARAVLRHAFSRRAVGRLVSLIVEGNLASERVANKLGMLRQGGQYVLGERPVALYEVQKKGDE